MDHSKQYSSTSRCLSRISKYTALSSANILKSAPKSIPPGVRCFNDDAVGSAVIGSGTFGTCYLANLGPLKCCKKVHRSEPQWLSYFYNELAMLMQLCHENLPFLYGAYVQENHPKSILMSLHLFAGDGKVLNVEDALSKDSLSLDWKCILYGSLSAIEYIHSKTILHNDIKGNNIVVESLLHGLRPVSINFGKACFLKDGRTYDLSVDKEKDMQSSIHMLHLKVVKVLLHSHTRVTCIHLAGYFYV